MSGTSETGSTATEHHEIPDNNTFRERLVLNFNILVIYLNFVYKNILYYFNQIFKLEKMRFFR